MLFLEEAWCTTQELTLGTRATPCAQLGDLSRLAMQKSTLAMIFKLISVKEKNNNVRVNVYL